MRKMIALLVSLGLTIVASADTVGILREETMQNLKENILPFWMEKAVDPAGGFYGMVFNDGKVVENAPKGAVLNARIIWTFSKAYRLDRQEKYKLMANRAADY
jgi:mannobiose 2-epimerase